MDEFREYDTIMITVSDGSEKEFAIIEEFDFEKNHYLVVSPVIEDEVQDGLYLYRGTETDGALEVSQIEDSEEFEKVSAFFEER